MEEQPKRTHLIRKKAHPLPRTDDLCRRAECASEDGVEAGISGSGAAGPTIREGIAAAGATHDPYGDDVIGVAEAELH